MRPQSRVSWFTQPSTRKWTRKWSRLRLDAGSQDRTRQGMNAQQIIYNQEEECREEEEECAGVSRTRVDDNKCESE
jgi:hypothetical protein